MKVGILTFHYALNYGAVLQAYALKTALIKMGHDVHVVNFRPEKMRTSWNFEAYCNQKKNGVSSSKKYNGIKQLLLYLLRKVKYIRFRLFEYDKLKRKYDLFNKFVNDYLCSDNTVIEDVNGLLELKKYDAIVYGSDQIWNPKITRGFETAYFGTNLDDGVKSISYAASVGDINNIAKHESTERKFLSLIKGINSISVREKNLCDYLCSKNVKAEWVLDPTLLLAEEDYKQVVEKRMVNYDYILVYSLSYDENIFKIAKSISTKNNWRIITVSGSKRLQNCSLQDVTPSIFLSLIKYAKVVITNSFHGTALSIVFHKDFYTVLPPKRKDRIHSLLNQFDLSGRIVDMMGVNNFSSSIDYKKIDEKVYACKTQSLLFLENAF